MPVATTDAFRRITVQPDNVTVVAEQVGDTLTLVAGSGISLVANTASDQITIVNTNTSSPSTDLFAKRLTVDGIVIDTNVIRSTDSNANLELDASGTGVVSVIGNLTVSGVIFKPNLPAFRIYGAGTTNNLTTTQNTTGVLNSNNFAVDYNQGSNLNTTTGVFTAPVAGLYQINVVARNSGFAGGISQIAVVKNRATTNTIEVMVEWAASSTMNHTGGSSVTKLLANDTLELRVLAGQINFDGNDNWSVAFLG
jgi:hypothetical protein